MPALSLMPSAARRTETRPGDAETLLMERVQHDEPDAFAELLDRCRGRTFARLYRCLHDRQEAEDLTQEVFLRLFRARKRWQPRAKFATWLFQITQNVARNALRARRRRRSVNVAALPECDRPATSPSLQDRPSEPMERRELAQAVRGAVAGLGGRQRTAFEMRVRPANTVLDRHGLISAKGGGPCPRTHSGRAARNNSGGP
ncbi:MAG: sigma-70 family RNA polymerase sigma factor [Gemmataceae bacterium]|nr:sigma-70 family RNA polymerase sigma factor [Gemmataceae bacterium]